MVGLSPFYFQRLFKRLVNKPLQEYIKLRRLAKSIEVLNTDNQRILDVALDYCFASHANYTRAFKDAFGITPGQLWAHYHKEKSTIEEYIQPSIELGMSYSVTAEKGTFSYFAGGLAKTVPENLPDGFVQRELSIGEYIVCSIEAESFEKLVTTALDQAGKYLFGTWLPKHELTTQPFSAEKYYITSQETHHMEIWVSPITTTK